MQEQAFDLSLHRFGDPGYGAHGTLAAAYGPVLFQTEPDISHIPVGRCVATPWNRIDDSASLRLGFGFLRRPTSCTHAVVALHPRKHTLHPVQLLFLGSKGSRDGKGIAQS